ncbi:hypothetical protein A0257_03530 [Hymenobacter psoromatis]|nr:hypothetical protein A0257_03530 [Hymenobacter psoromatis]
MSKQPASAFAPAAAGAAGLPGGLFFGLLGLGALALCAGYAALVLHTATWAEARALDAIFPATGWHLSPFSAAGFQHLRLVLTLLGLALGTSWLGLALGTRVGRAELLRAGQEVRGALGELGRALGELRELPRRARWLAVGALLALLAVRTYMSTSGAAGDDMLSYELFVRQRLLAVSAYYPLPNNHVLSNTISWAFYQLHPRFWWSMRLPVLLTSLAGTLVLFAGLRRWVGVGAAALAAGAFSWLQLSLYYAAAGRGYWLVNLLAGLVFFCVLKLCEPPGGQRAAWVGLLGAAILGGYTVPTFAYVLAAALSWLGGQALWQRAPRRLLATGAVGLLAGAGVGLLYAPLLLVSGPAQLLANPYVQSWPWVKFWRALPAYVWLTEGFLAGQRSVGAVLTLVVLGLFGRLCYRAATGQLPRAQALRVWQVGLPALWFVLVPYALLLVQRVQPPERTLLYKAWFFFILVALVAEDWPWHRPARRWLAVVGGGLFLLYQAGTALRLNYKARHPPVDSRAVPAPHGAPGVGALPIQPRLIPGGSSNYLGARAVSPVFRYFSSCPLSI